MFSETAVPQAEQMLLLSLWTWVSTNKAFTDVCINLQHFISPSCCRMRISLQTGWPLDSVCVIVFHRVFSAQKPGAEGHAGGTWEEELVLRNLLDVTP